MNDADRRFLKSCVEAGDSVELVAAYSGFSESEVRHAAYGTHVDREKVIAAWNARVAGGSTVATLAADFGCSDTTICTIFVQAGLPRRRYVKRDKPQAIVDERPMRRNSPRADQTDAGCQ